MRRRRMGTMATVVLFAAAAAAPARAGDEPAAPKPPTLAPVVERVAQDVTSCDGPCWARDVVTDSSPTLTLALRQVGSSDRPVEPVAPRLVLQGDPGVLVYPNVLYAAAADSAHQAQLSVELGDDLDPGHYGGSLYMDFSTGADTLVVPVELNVKQGPLLPLLALAVAVALGWAIAKVSSLRPKRQFADDAERLRVQIAALPNTERSLLTELLNRTLDKRGSSFATAQTELAALAAGADALRNARNFEDAALARAGAQTLVPWVQRIRAAFSQLTTAVRQHHESYDDELGTVEATADELGTALAVRHRLDALKHRAAAAMGQAEPHRAFMDAVRQVESMLERPPEDPAARAASFETPMERVEEAFRALEEAHGQPLPEMHVGRAVAPAGLGGEAVAATRDLLSWTPAQAAPAQRAARFDVAVALSRWLGPPATMLTLLVLLAVGFKTTYLDNATFGAACVDWLTLAFWGLAAYGAREALTGLQSGSQAPAKAKAKA